jgi:hypothetical protein
MCVYSMDVWMYVCMHVYIPNYRYVCVYIVRMYACVYVCMYVCVYVCIYEIGGNA